MSLIFVLLIVNLLVIPGVNCALNGQSIPTHLFHHKSHRKNVPSFLFLTRDAYSTLKSTHIASCLPARKSPGVPQSETKGMDVAILVECGSGCCHGRDSTKAAVRACRNAVEFNSVKVSAVVPGGYDALRIHVQIGAPDPGSGDLDAVAAAFPYGTLLPVVVGEGGLRGSNTVRLPGTGEAREDITLAVACVTLGYNRVVDGAS